MSDEFREESPNGEAAERRAARDTPPSGNGTATDDPPTDEARRATEDGTADDAGPVGDETDEVEVDGAETGEVEAGDGTAGDDETDGVEAADGETDHEPTLAGIFGGRGEDAPPRPEIRPESVSPEHALFVVLGIVLALFVLYRTAAAVVPA